MGSKKRLGKTSSAEVDSLETDELLEQLDRVRRNIQRIDKAVREQAEPFEPCEMECRLDILNDYIKKAFDLQLQIEQINIDISCRADLEDLCVSARSFVMSACSRSNKDKDNRSIINMSELNTSMSRSRYLPHMKLPKFDGNYADFKNFIGLFKSLVDADCSLSNVEKFNHLLSCLEKEALGTVKAYQITDDNYAKALESLTRVYDNPCLIFFDSIARLFNIPTMSHPSAASLRSLIDTVTAIYESLLSLGNDQKIANAMIIHIVMSKVDPKTRSRWEEQMDYQSIPLWKQCADSLNKRYQHLAADESTSGKLKHNKASRDGSLRKTSKTSLTVSQSIDTANPKCSFCKSMEHYIQNCASFANMSVEARFKLAKSFPLCINCLRKGHGVSQCKSSNCRVCSKPHHTLLHRYNSIPQVSGSSVDAAPKAIDPNFLQQSVNSALNHNESEGSDQVLLATALVDVRNQSGQKQMARILLDSGSQVNFITEELAKGLNLKRYRHDIKLSGIGNSQLTARHAVQTTICSRINSFEMVVEFIVLKSISSYNPVRSSPVTDWIPENLTLADPQFYKPKRIDILIGADVFFDLLQAGKVRHNDYGPTLQNTVFGWVASGSFKSAQSPRSASCSMLGILDESATLDSILGKFWEIEKVPDLTSAQLYTPEQALCEKVFVDTISRQPSGRFVVSLPFKSSPSSLGHSYDTARRRFLALERRMYANPTVQEMYLDFMREYLELGHMSATDNVVPNKPHYFIPYQCILRPQSASTKLRVVFDASSKTTSQISLNNILMVGPTIQPCVYATLLRFRFRPFAMTADITKMYRQVMIDENQRDFQMIIWRRSQDEPLQIYRLNTVTYGTASAPFLAIRCLKQLSEIHAKSHPLGSKAVADDFYVDDLLSGADTLEELKSLRQEIILILESAGFVLAKWAANCDMYDSPVQEAEIPLGETGDTKTLGLTWSPLRDVFKFSIHKFSQEVEPTKRSILSFAARLFDPLGLICPLVTLAKILIQKLWSLKIGWDEKIPPETFKRWESVVSSFQELDTLNIPRHVGTNRRGTYQIHGFADASEDAYGCCLYVRTVDSHGVKTTLLTAKSRVSPINRICIPRLELCAAHLLAKLWHDVQKIIDFHIEKVFMWSDSEVVLYWLRTSLSTLKTFVANRVSAIHELAPTAVWRHVPTALNPADLPSRGCTVKELRESFWFDGPSFLERSPSTWPSNPHLSDTLPDAQAEIRASATTHITSELVSNPILNIVENSSSYLKIIRIVAFISRFLYGRKWALWTTSSLSSSEYAFSFLTIVQAIQHETLAIEFEKLSKKHHLQNSYQKLNPFISTETVGYRTLQLLRVGGRLLHAPLEHNAKFPLLMPKGNNFVRLYIQHLHRTNCHVGPRALVGLLRQSIWLVNARRECSAVVRRCILCFRYKPRLLTQIMGNLPADRFLSSRPFRVSGVDLFGPIRVSLGIRGKTPVKMYVAVFICFSTKAIHLELLKDLTSNSFLLCLSRFIGRRGPLDKLYCDNATNFVGSARMLQEISAHLDSTSETFGSFGTRCKVDFIFIPPRAPHFGGLWEAAVKSAKHLLIKAVGNALLKEDEVQTVLVEVEAVLNSRPLVADSNNPNDGEAITPAHFLVGTTLAALPPVSLPSSAKDNLGHLQRWQLVSAIKQRFWREWSREYLSSLQQRAKWTKDFANLTIGTVVVIREDNLPPQHWLLGIVTEVILGPDGKVRVAIVKTRSGIYKRAIHHLAPLPLD